MQPPTSNYGCGDDACTACYGDEEWRAARVCEIVLDGYDVNEDGWHYCIVHDETVFGDAPYCEGFRPEVPT